jgi:glutathione S-transferase
MLQNGELFMSTDLTLYYNPLTVNSIKVILLCNALSIVPEYKLLQLQKGEHKSGLFLTINPEGRVPVLKDSNFFLTESAAILQYLAHKYQSPLWPDKMEHQAQVLKWLFWQGNEWNKTVGSYAHQQVVLPHWRNMKPEAFSEQHQENFEKIMSTFDRALNDKKYLVGDHLTIADISIASYLIFAEQAKIPLTQYQNVRCWLENLSVKPWWQETQQQLLKILSPKS